MLMPRRAQADEGRVFGRRHNVALRQQLRAIGLQSHVFSDFGLRVHPRPEQYDQVGSPIEPNNEGR